jgi:hypothetical protein
MFPLPRGTTLFARPGEPRFLAVARVYRATAGIEGPE